MKFGDQEQLIRLDPSTRRQCELCAKQATHRKVSHWPSGNHNVCESHAMRTVKLLGTCEDGLGISRAGDAFIKKVNAWAATKES